MIEFTENQVEWLKKMLEAEIKEAFGSASNNHLWALGSETDEESVMFEESSDAWRDYAEKLQELIKKPYALKGEINMKYILIHVYEREINTVQFSTFAEARHFMMSMLKKSVWNYFEDEFEEEFGMDIDEFFEQKEFQEIEDFGFYRHGAWCNLSDEYEDWKIVELY